MLRWVAFCLFAMVAPCWAGDDDGALLDRLARAYPEALAGHAGRLLIWRDGTQMDADSGPGHGSEAAVPGGGSILDQVRAPYPGDGPAGLAADPGRIRNRAFFDKMYGDCLRGEVAPHLVAVPWPGGHAVRMTTINHLSKRLGEVARELAALPEADRRFLSPPGGGYLCRSVASTGQPSMHAHGAAIDINPATADFWGWRAGGYRNRVPAPIVAAFERHGFIWGGRWSHFDTMHFEYRPELLPAATSPDRTPQ